MKNFWLNSKPTFAFTSKTSLDIELKFQTIYPNTFPVLFSSARASIPAILELYNKGRNDQIFTAPYSSHCVLEAISRKSTPTLNYKANLSFNYHQLGFVFANLPSEIIVDDRADSFIFNSENIFKHSAISLISLPKVLGTFSGGLCLCQSIEIANELKNIRDYNFDYSFLKYITKSLSYYRKHPFLQLWHGIESVPSRLHEFALNNISEKLNSFHSFSELRKNNIETLKDIIPIKQNDISFPSAIPFRATQDIIQYFKQYNIEIEKRFFNSSLDWALPKLEQLHLLPVHHEIPSNIIRNAPWTSLSSAQI
ncbi:putative PLP-dependent aminotransferase [Bacteriovorax sp. Seq25_V]|uniref:putative PLP-dependent aminotransferase n=1 Tax=Bacteriovorax sp. Seq25_V TaxID=1201288 RepID=UPI00038A30E7|nr:putative PLP-dependent aminotransferase [Bacteriovorax sp. Seq25_V]EQC43296.1 hypothetical protein M900_0056 [Bacteriovorax sp. Seq25_V]